MGEGLHSLLSGGTTHRRAHAVPYTQSRQQEDHRSSDSMKPVESVRPGDDKLAALRNYRRAKGLCFTCGERWSRDHKCQAVQLHVVQEMVDFLQYANDFAPPSPSDTYEDMELMNIAADNDIGVMPEKSIVLNCIVQGKPVIFLLDSGSNNSFIGDTLADQIGSKMPLPSPRRVKVAAGGILQCTHFVPQCTWKCGQVEFCSSFKILSLQGYDGILGMDWSSSHSPQIVEWNQKWLTFHYQGSWVCLQGQLPSKFSCTVIEVQLLSELWSTDALILAEIQFLLDTFPSVFTEPDGLPPKRQLSHSIPSIHGARPVQIRPYRFAPALKEEIEQQISDMLKYGMIRPSTSSFASPLLMIKKKDNTWHPCVDYRHLNALTVKSKYPLPIGSLCRLSSN